eukprot:jgi/Mesen1/2844/ME000174S02094
MVSRSALVAFFAFVVLLSSVAQAQPGPQPGPKKANGERIVSSLAVQASADPWNRYSTFLKLLVEVGADKDLATFFSNGGKATILAPTNAAFARLPNATLDTLRSNSTRLKSVLLFHVIPKFYTFNELTKLKVGTSFPTLYPPFTLARWYFKRTSNVILFPEGDRNKPVDYALILRANLAIVKRTASIQGIGIVLKAPDIQYYPQ